MCADQLLEFRLHPQLLCQFLLADFMKHKQALFGNVLWEAAKAKDATTKLSEAGNRSVVLIRNEEPAHFARIHSEAGGKDFVLLGVHAWDATNDCAQARRAEGVPIQ